MRLISSELALREILALAAGGELSLSELARSVGIGPSAAQRALEVLLEDGVAERERANGRSGYRLAASETVEHLLGLVRCVIPRDEALTIVGHANRAVEFVALGRTKAVVVFAAVSTSRDQSRAALVIDAIAKRAGVDTEYLDHDDVRRRLLDEPGLRRQVEKMKLLHGSLDRSFPDRSRHSVTRGRTLGRPNPALPLPSPHALRMIMKRHQLASLKLFGSAVRSDFRADSDVDVLIEFKPGVRPTLRSMTQLEEALERLFHRDVHLTRENQRRPEARAAIDDEAIPLL